VSFGDGLPFIVPVNDKGRAAVPRGRRSAGGGARVRTVHPEIRVPAGIERGWCPAARAPEASRTRYTGAGGGFIRRGNTTRRGQVKNYRQRKFAYSRFQLLMLTGVRWQHRPCGQTDILWTARV
jgi:hypothetical protein